MLFRHRRRRRRSGGATAAPAVAGHRRAPPGTGDLWWRGSQRRSDSVVIVRGTWGDTPPPQTRTHTYLSSSAHIHDMSERPTAAQPPGRPAPSRPSVRPLLSSSSRSRAKKERTSTTIIVRERARKHVTVPRCAAHALGPTECSSRRDVIRASPALPARAALAAAGAAAGARTCARLVINKRIAKRAEDYACT